MKEVRKITSTEKPKIIKYLGDGSYYYNYNINESKDEDLNIYEYIQVRLWGKANYNECVKSIIRLYLTIDEEFDLINSANKDLLIGLNSSDSISKYLEYLEFLNNIKSNVKKDFNQNEK